MSATFLVITTGGAGATGIQRRGVMLNTLQGTGQAPTPNSYAAHTVSCAQLRTPDAEGKEPPRHLLRGERIYRLQHNCPVRE